MTDVLYSLKKSFNDIALFIKFLVKVVLHLDKHCSNSRNGLANRANALRS